MKKKNTLLYLIIIGVLLLGGILGIVIALLTGHTLAEMFSSTMAKTIYIAIGAFLVVLCALLIMDWGKK